MVKKLRVSLALQPVATALFANSPFTDGQAERLPVDALRDLARHRQPTAPACSPSPSRTAWATSATSTGRSTCRCISSSAAPSITTSPAPPSAISSPASCRNCRASAPTLSDWANHLSTLFPEVRLKRYLEMRGADVGPRERIVALPALLGRAPLRRGRPRRRLGPGQGLVDRGARAPARRGAPPRPQGRDRRPPAARRGARRPGPVARRAGAARRARRHQGATRRAISIRSSASSRPGARRPRRRSTNIAARGAVPSSRPSATACSDE